MRKSETLFVNRLARGVPLRRLAGRSITGLRAGAEGGSRTHTPIKATDFKSVVSTIPPLRLFNIKYYSL